MKQKSVFGIFHYNLNHDTRLPGISPSKGHLANNSRNRKTLLDLINDSSCYVGTDKDGCKWYIKIAKNGAQYWAKVKNCKLSNGGYNRSPKIWDEETGFCKNPDRNKDGNK